MNATLEAPDDKPVILMTRVFDAPRDLVWKATTDPKHTAQWWGPRGYEVESCEMDLRVGGEWRIAQRDAEGNSFAFKGEYLEIVPQERLVQTFGMEGMGGSIVETYAYEDLGQKTRIVIEQRFNSFEERAGMLASGMEKGANESWERLDELLAKIS